MSPELILTMLHIGAFVFYGGMTFQVIRDHDRRISRLENMKDDEAKMELRKHAHTHAARAGAD